MQFKLSFFSFVSLAAIAAATPTRRGEPASSCTTGPIQCCENVESASSSDATNILGALGIVLSDLNVLVGITCSPIAGSTCSAQSVCCNDNAFGGLISIGCVPVSL